MRSGRLLGAILRFILRLLHDPSMGLRMRWCYRIRAARLWIIIPDWSIIGLTIFLTAFVSVGMSHYFWYKTERTVIIERHYSATIDRTWEIAYLGGIRPLCPEGAAGWHASYMALEEKSWDILSKSQ